MPFPARPASSIDRSPKRVALFLSKIKIDEVTSCWIWIGNVCKRSGYGNFGKLKAYVYSYLVHKGDLAAGHEPDHLCRIRPCVNPDHLEAVTRRVNLLRGNTIPARKAAQTHCEKGHEFTEENIYRNRNGTRGCRKCRHAYNLKWCAEHREYRRKWDNDYYAKVRKHKRKVAA